jgi:Baseplate hub gp41
MAYSAKQITLEIQLGTGSFGESGTNTVTLQNLRVEAELLNVMRTGPVSSSAGRATVRVFGLTLNQINQLTKAGTMIAAANNTLIVSAGDANGMQTVFSGTVWQAYPDFRMPNSGFVFLASGGYLIQLKPAAPTSFSGPTDVATAMGTLAGQIGYRVENNSVSVQVSSPYLKGTIGQQIASLAHQANVYHYLDQTTQTLAIWPKNGARGGSVPVISPETGMIGYPAFQVAGVQVRTLFNPEIVPGIQVQIQSQLQAASGTFQVATVSHHIASQMPDGPWETDILAMAPGYTG